MPAASSTWLGPDRDFDGALRRPQWDRPAKPKPRDPMRVPSATPPPPPRAVQQPAADAVQTPEADGKMTRRPRGGKKITAARLRREQEAMQAEDKQPPNSATATGEQAPQCTPKEGNSHKRAQSKSKWWHSNGSWWNSSGSWWQDQASNSWAQRWNQPSQPNDAQGAQAPPRTPVRWANQIGATARIHQRAILRIPGKAAAKAKPKAAAKAAAEPPAPMEEDVPSTVPTTEAARLSRLLDRPLQVEPEKRKRRRNKIATP